jgi:hypothetical protein
MLKKSLLSVLVALMVIFWAGQPAQAQSGVDNATTGKNCPERWRVKQNGKWGYIDKTGLVVIPCKFDGAEDFSEGLAAVVIKEKWGYIDKTGKVVIPPRFLSGYPFSSGMALVVTKEFKKDRYQMHKLGYIDRSGKLVIQRKEALDSKSLFVSSKDLFFSEGFLRVTENGKDGYLDRTGKQIIPCRFDYAQPFSEGLAAVSVGCKDGYIDRSGKMVIPPQLKEAGSFSEGSAIIRLNDKEWGYIDTSGKLVINGEEFSLAREFSEGLAAVTGKNDKYGFIDKTGKFVIPPQYDRVGDFSEGLAAVQKFGESWPGNLAYINKKGAIVIHSMSTDRNSPDRVEWDLHNYRFCGGMALVSAGNEADEDAQVYINQEGKIISPVIIPTKKKPGAPGRK